MESVYDSILKLFSVGSVKDHPRIKNGQKTRLWCSQDAAHSRKLKMGQSTSIGMNTDSDNLDIVGKARYTCHSHLTITSQEAALKGYRLITIRMRHRGKHEPYFDSSMPSKTFKTIWEGIVTRPTVLPTPLETNETQSICDSGAKVTRRTSNESDLGRDSGGFPCEDEHGLKPVGMHGRGNEGLDVYEEHESKLTLESEPETSISEASMEMFQDRMRGHISSIRDFCDGLEYQLQFADYRMLDALEKEGASFLRLVHDCLRREGRL
jgi:hypothetical protein